MERMPAEGALHLAVVYLVWGSTYLAIRVAVREGSGFPPFYLGAARVLAAAVLLFAWVLLSRRRLLPRRSELAVLAGSGLLMWTGGNGLVTWAETRADSGLAALMVGSMPIWALLIESVLDRRVPGPRLAASVLLGFGGVSLLFRPVIVGGVGGDLPSMIALLGAPLSWALGSVWVARRTPGLGVLALVGWQHLFGGAGFLVLAFLGREPFPAPVGEAWAAWAYLVLLGSALAFSSYMSALRLLPLQVVMTYTYANPVIAMLLGWMVLGERVTAWTFAGALLVVAGIAGVLNNSLEKRTSGGQAAETATQSPNP